MKWFVWLKNLKGGYDPQLWSDDYADGPAPYYRADCHREIAERLAQKIKLPPEEQNITLACAIEKYPQPAPVQ
jgi:hypothetical protein